MLINRFLKIFFRYLYHQLAWTYDCVAAIVSLGRWDEWVEYSTNYLDGHKILELGVGPGHLIAKLAQSGKQVYGIDNSAQMVSIASKRLDRLKLPINLSIAQAQSLPFGVDEFDQVVATFPTEYIFEETTQEEIFRVLKPGGSAVILPVAYITGTYVFDKAASWLFNITGQAPQFDLHVIKPALRAGFDVTIKHIVLKTSIVILILARKNLEN